jgi:hypothetical protein
MGGGRDKIVFDELLANECAIRELPQERGRVFALLGESVNHAAAAQMEYSHASMHPQFLTVGRFILQRNIRLPEKHKLLGAIAAALLAACGSGDLTLNEADPDIVPQKPTFAQVYPIFQRDCIPCHSGIDLKGGDEDDDDERRRAGRAATAASVEPGLESCQAIVSNLKDIVEDIFEKNNMPPGAWPRLTSKEKLIIERWIATNPETRCN